MRKPTNSLVIDYHCNTPVMGLRFEKDYYLICNQKTLEGKQKNKFNSVTNPELIYSKVLKNTHFTLSGLEHSYETHLMDMGDLKTIQKLPQHKSTETTGIYAHKSIKNRAALKCYPMILTFNRS